MTSSHTPRLPIQAPEGIKSPVATATIDEIDLEGLQIINGYQLNVNDRVLVKDQTNLANNGIYSAQKGAWVRAKDWKVSQQVANGVLILDNNTSVLWRANFAGVLNIGITDVTFSNVTSKGSLQTFVQEEKPVGPIIEGARWYIPSKATTYVFYYDESGDGVWVEEPVAIVDQEIDGTISFETTQDMIDGVFAITGQLAFNRERGNAQYVLSPIGYVAQVGDVVTVDGRVWALRINGNARVEYFGAVGDGETLDNQAFLDASQRGAVELGSKKTYIVENIDLNGATIIGNGSTLALPESSSRNYIIKSGGDDILTLVDVNLDASGGAVGNNCVLIVSGGIKAKGCTFSGAKLIGGWGEGLQIATSTLKSEISDCVFENNGSHGVSMQFSPASSYYGCTARNNGGTGFYFNNFDLTLTKKIRNLQIGNCVSHNNGSSGFIFGNPLNDNVQSGGNFGWDNGVIETVNGANLLAYENGVYGFSFSQRESSLSNIHSKGNTFGGILINGSDITLSNPFVYDNGSYGIDVGHGRHINITGGELAYNAPANGEGLLIEASLKVSVTGTYIHDNGNSNNAQIKINAVGGTGTGSFFPIKAADIQLTCRVQINSNRLGLYIIDNPSDVLDANTYDGDNPLYYVRFAGASGNYFYGGSSIDQSYEPTVSGGVLVVGDTTRSARINTTDTLGGIECHSFNFFKGKISYIGMASQGSGYTVANTTMEIVGDGTGATLLPIINGGKIIGARVVTNGSGYTTASVSITGDGTGAVANANIGSSLPKGKVIGIAHNQPQSITRLGTINIAGPVPGDYSAPAGGYTELEERYGQWLLKSKNY